MTDTFPSHYWEVKKLAAAAEVVLSMHYEDQFSGDEAAEIEALINLRQALIPFKEAKENANGCDTK